MKQINIGQITTTFGIKGELKVMSDSDFIAERLAVGKTIQLEQNGASTSAVISSLRFHQNIPLITINNLTNINDVLSYVGASILVDDNQDLELSDDEYFLDDLIDCEVFNTQNECLGVVQEIIILPSSAVMEIVNAKNEKILIPFVKEYIQEVSENRIVIQEIEGFR